MIIDEKITLWRSRLYPELSNDEFKKIYNLCHIDKWCEELDNFFEVEIKTMQVNNNIHKWYKLFTFYDNYSIEEFIEKYELHVSEWTNDIELKMEQKLFLAHKQLTYQKINEWFDKFNKLDPTMTKHMFMKKFNISGVTKWNIVLENMISKTYFNIVEKVTNEKFEMFFVMWPELTKNMFEMLYGVHVDVEFELTIMFTNVELYHKLMKASYDSGKFYSFNRMIHELDITIEQVCNKHLKNKIDKFIAGNI